MSYSYINKNKSYGQHATNILATSFNLPYKIQVNGVQYVQERANVFPSYCFPVYCVCFHLLLYVFNECNLENFKSAAMCLRTVTWNTSSIRLSHRKDNQVTKEKVAAGLE